MLEAVPTASSGRNRHLAPQASHFKRGRGRPIFDFGAFRASGGAPTAQPAPPTPQAMESAEGMGGTKVRGLRLAAGVARPRGTAGGQGGRRKRALSGSGGEAGRWWWVSTRFRPHPSLATTCSPAPVFLAFSSKPLLNVTVG